MTAVFAPLREAATYRSLLYLTSAIPLGTAAFTVLVVGWTLTAVLLITPAVVFALVAFRAGVYGVARFEALLARELLGVDVAGPRRALSGGRGLWGRVKATFADAGFWREQAYLGLRTVLGWPLGVAVLSLIAASLYVVSLPVTYRWSGDTEPWRIDTLQEAVLALPIGLAGLVLSAHLVRVLARAWRPVAERFLRPTGASRTDPRRLSALRRRGLGAHAVAASTLSALVVLIWALTGGPFWPVWVMLGLAIPLAIHAWVILVEERPDLWRARLLTKPLAIEAGLFGTVALTEVAVWFLSGRGYFWPIWSIAALALILVVHRAAVGRRGPDREELEERIGVLETTRAAAVDEQDSELRRIERDLHDGAQARLVALGMNLGMAEQKLRADPTGAAELVEEARIGVEEALRELRDLARGIHPPVLADRGLEAAIAALADRSAIPVLVSADVPTRPAAPVETAAYFVAAEALTNAAKHGGASRIEVHIARVGDTLSLEVVDDGRGGADAGGSGLSGLRRRVEALDGRLTVSSPPGGPTTIRAELPCAS